MPKASDLQQIVISSKLEITMQIWGSNPPRVKTHKIFQPTNCFDLDGNLLIYSKKKMISSWKTNMEIIQGFLELYTYLDSPYEGGTW
jgi:hypothetical protein